MRKLLYYISFQTNPSFNKELVSVHFKDIDNNSYIWIPKWKDVRNLYGVAIAREGMKYGIDTKEMALFLKQIKEIPLRLEKYQEFYKHKDWRLKWIK